MIINKNNIWKVHVVKVIRSKHTVSLNTLLSICKRLYSNRILQDFNDILITDSSAYENLSHFSRQSLITLCKREKKKKKKAHIIGERSIKVISMTVPSNSVLERSKECSIRRQRISMLGEKGFLYLIGLEKSSTKNHICLGYIVISYNFDNDVIYISYDVYINITRYIKSR